MHRRIASPASVLAAGATLLGLTSAASASIIFVNAAQVLPPIQQNGNSWATAYKSLQSAIAAAGSGDQIWVAQGTYTPTTGTDRSATFIVQNGVKVFGGFVVGASSLGDREPLVNKTILSGNIGAAGNADNSFHVVTIGPGATTLSGFFVTGGNANGGGNTSIGGGIVVTASADARVSECFVHGNTAALSGGGLGMIGATTLLQIANSVFTGNTAGAGASNSNVGGAIDFQGGDGELFLCTIVGNSGGGVRYLNTTGSATVASTILRDNLATGTILDQQLHISSATVAPTANNIEGGLGLFTATIDADPKFLDADGADGIPGNADDNYTLRGDSPCIEKGSSNQMPGDFGDLDGDGIFAEQLPRDLALNVRRIDDPISTATGFGAAPYADIGALEYVRPRTILVNHAAVGANNGTSWANAYTNLQDAIAELNDVKFGGPGEIWVAKGTYKPTTSTDQTISFKPGHGVKMFGGFNGGELSRTARNPRLNQTILSGDIGAAGSLGNSNHVLRFTGTFITEETVVDGFTIRDGLTANGSVNGGGVFAELDASPTIANCLITGNTGTGLANAVQLVGGGSGTPTLINCVIAGNSSTSSGMPGVLVSAVGARIVNCVVAGNAGASPNASAFQVVNAPMVLKNTLIFANTSTGGATPAAQITTGGAAMTFSHCAIQGFNAANFPGANIASTFAVGIDGDVIDGNGADNIFGTPDDDYSTAACSSLIDAGAVVGTPSDVADVDEDGNTSETWPLDYLGDDRLVDLPTPNIIVGSQGAVDIGVMERQTYPLADPDYNNDGKVDAADLAQLLGAWGTFGTSFDLDGDCGVGGQDLAILLGAWT